MVSSVSSTCFSCTSVGGFILGVEGALGSPGDRGREPSDFRLSGVDATTEVGSPSNGLDNMRGAGVGEMDDGTVPDVDGVA